MKETLLDIVKTIYSAQPVLKKKYLSGVAARVNGSFDGIPGTYWFVVSSSIPSVYREDEEVKAFGQFVPRNSMVAIKILNEELGTPIEYATRNHIRRLVEHHHVIFNRSDLVNKTIALVNDKQLYSYTDIGEFLNALRLKSEEISQNEKKQREQAEKIEELKKLENTAHERSVLTKGLNKLQEEYRILTLQQEEMKSLTRFIRQQGKLRFNPILDPIQNRIKTGHLFDGKTIIIEGGPGTGKTTTMIQRLKYLTDTYAIEEDFLSETGLYNLTDSQRDDLLNAIKDGKDWVFFSPSKLLKEYLSDAMNREGLANTRDKVYNWQDFCKKVIRDHYHLFDPTNDNAPFKAGRIKDTLFFQTSTVIQDFTDYFLNQLRLIKSRFPKIDESAVRYKWTSIAITIRDSFDKCDEYTISQFVILFNRLENSYAAECRELLKENRETIKQIADEISILISERYGLREEIEDLFMPTATDQNEDVDDDVESIEEELSDKVVQTIRQWFKRYCYSKQNKDIKLSPRQEKLSELLLPILTEKHKEKISRVGELALFEQFAKYTRGVVSNIIGGFPAKYKRFRRKMLMDKNPGWNFEVLKELVHRRDGKELHPQEQSLLIGFINNMVKMVLKVDSKSRHAFIDAYLELSRPIIGIDEATDFCKCDIYAMQSLLSTNYNSLTLSGDMMQRLTQYGITDWKDIDDIVDNPEVVKMRTSYRQSSNLLNVARQLYTDTIGVEPNYKAHMKSTKVPKPLAFVSDDEEDKVEWIVNRIKEVYIAYGRKLPSIAIFLNDRNSISQFIELLNDTDFIVDTDIKVLNGSDGNVLSDSNDIRVYPIDVVKGMEFDVVFFHNIDKTKENTELLKRYIYVGVSRAAFFLGITLSEEDEDICKYFTLGQQWDRIL